LSGILPRITLGGLVYRVGPDQRRDVVAFCGVGNGGAIVNGVFAAHYFLTTDAGEIIDFSVGDWKDDIHLNSAVLPEAEARLGPIQWSIDPPDFHWDVASKFQRSANSGHTPELGRAWYTGFSGDRAGILEMIAEERAGKGELIIGLLRGRIKKLKPRRARRCASLEPKGTAVMTDNNNTAFHFSTTARLPWIIESGELQPSPVLWATTNPDGDLACAAQSAASFETYQRGLSQMVRFTLPKNCFSKWSDILRFPDWTAEDVARIEQAVLESGESGFENWRFRLNPLPISTALVVEAMSVTVKRWVPVDVSAQSCIHLDLGGASRGVVVGKQVYLTGRVVLPEGVTAFINLGVANA
jgi:hypothetical protein